MKTIQDAVQAQFAPAAANYATSPVHAQGADLTRLVELAGLTGSERVLDVGCGAGHTALALAPAAREVIAYDLTPSMLAQVEQLAAERGLSGLVTRQGDAAALPFEEGVFDLVVTRYSAHHWPDVPTAVREMFRVVKPGGRVLIDDIIAPEVPLLDTWLQTLELLRDPSHVRDYRASEWLGFLQSAGFGAALDMTWRLTLDFDSWVARIGTPEPHLPALHHLMAGAPQEVRRHFEMTFDEGAGGRLLAQSFVIDGALFSGRKRMESVGS